MGAMNRARITAVILVACGLAGVSIALGFLYADFTRREGAWVELRTHSGQMSDQERLAVLQAWKGPDNFAPALVAGTLGVAALGAGTLLALFEMPFMRPKEPTAPR
jgi:hypothetical protein